MCVAKPNVTAEGLETTCTAMKHDLKHQEVNVQRSNHSPGSGGRRWPCVCPCAGDPQHYTVTWEDKNSHAHLVPVWPPPLLTTACSLQAAFSPTPREATARAISTLESGLKTLSPKTAKTGLEPVGSWYSPSMVDRTPGTTKTSVHLAGS